MALPSLDDPRLDTLVQIHAGAAQALTDLLDELIFAEGVRKFNLFQEALGILQGLSESTDSWVETVIPQLVRESEDEVLAILGDSPAFIETTTANITRNAASSVSGFLNKARGSIANLTTRVFRATDITMEFRELAIGVRLPADPAAADLVLQQTVGNKLRQRFRKNLVSFSVAGGRQFEAPLDFYAAMIVSNAKTQLQAAVVVTRSKEVGQDLVQVSGNKSKTGDWCDAYAGQVFSISGADETFPPLSAVPNGGPPFHPFCRHSLTPFFSSEFTEKQLDDFSSVDDAFLVKGNETDANRVARNWWASKNNG